MSALGENGLASLGRQDVVALANQLPSLQVNQYSPTITIFNIRGVSQNDFADSQEAPIAFYNDEVYVSALGAISGMTYDLERVEVLRGPQGTLFGRNATGGLTHIISAKPTSRPEGFATLTVGSYGQIATEGAISGPIAPGVRGRFSYTTNHGGAYLRNGAGPDIGGAKFYAGRVQLAIDVGAAGDLLLKLQGLRNDNDRQAGLYTHAAAVPDANGVGRFVRPNENPFGTCNGCDVFGYRSPDNDPFTVDDNGPNYFDRRYWSATARYTQGLGNVRLTSITDYQRLIKRNGEDGDLSPATNFVYRTDQDLYQLSQELRLANDGGAVNWVAGLYGIRIDTDNGYVTDLRGTLGLLEAYDTKLRTDSLAAFGQVEVPVGNDWAVIGGVRYSKDWKTYSYVHAENGVRDFVFDRATFPGLAKRSFGDWSGKLELNYKPTTALLVYASVNRGVKSGGFATPVFGPFNPADFLFDGERLTSYEGGFKATLFDRMMTFNAAVFLYDYGGYQSFQAQGLALLIRNKQAHVKGIEVETTLRPLPGLYLQAFGTALDTRIDDVVFPTGLVRDGVMPQAPGLSVGVNGRYEFAAGPGRLAVQTNWKYNSVQYLSSFRAEVDREPARVAGDVRLSYALDTTPIEIAAFVNNVTDRRYRVYNLDISSAIGITQQTFARPRWIGASITVRMK